MEFVWHLFVCLFIETTSEMVATGIVSIFFISLIFVGRILMHSNALTFNQKKMVAVNQLANPLDNLSVIANWYWSVDNWGFISVIFLSDVSSRVFFIQCYCNRADVTNNFKSLQFFLFPVFTFLVFEKNGFAFTHSTRYPCIFALETWLVHAI